MSYELHSAPPMVKVAEVIITERAEGEGTEEEPVRVVRYIHNMDGRLLGKLDEIADEKLIEQYPHWRA